MAGTNFRNRENVHVNFGKQLILKQNLPLNFSDLLINILQSLKRCFIYLLNKLQYIFYFYLHLVRSVLSYSLGMIKRSQTFLWGSVSWDRASNWTTLTSSWTFQFTLQMSGCILFIYFESIRVGANFVGRVFLWHLILASSYFYICCFSPDLCDMQISHMHQRK